jgi:hypothetical protein
MVTRIQGFAFAGLVALALAAGWATTSVTVARAAAPPSATPTPVPTPFMELALIPNGRWQIIIEEKDIQYSWMTLKADGTTVAGTWSPDKKTNYIVSGVREGAHLKLDIKSSNAPDATVVGKVDATLDGIADMFGTITINGVEKPFQGAQHTRVPPPVDSSSPGPGGGGVPGGGPGGPGGGGYPGQPGGQPGQPGYPGH